MMGKDKYFTSLRIFIHYTLLCQSTMLGIPRQTKIASLGRKLFFCELVASVLKRQGLQAVCCNSVEMTGSAGSLLHQCWNNRVCRQSVATVLKRQGLPFSMYTSIETTGSTCSLLSVRGSVSGSWVLNLTALQHVLHKKSYSSPHPTPFADVYPSWWWRTFKLCYQVHFCGE